MPLQTDNFIYLQRDFSAKRDDLLPGRVLWTNGALLAAEMDIVTFSYEAGKRLAMLYEDRQFVTQDVVVEGVLDLEPADAPSFEELSRMDFDEDSRPVVVVLERIGLPILAESRECFRVRTVALNVTIQLGSCPECELHDISHTGFAVLSDELLTLNSIVEAALPSGDTVAEGYVKILSVRRLRNGRYRYGVSAEGRQMLSTCASLATELQRRMLRRTVGLQNS